MNLVSSIQQSTQKSGVCIIMHALSTAITRKHRTQCSINVSKTDTRFQRASAACFVVVVGWFASMLFGMLNQTEGRGGGWGGGGGVNFASSFYYR